MEAKFYRAMQRAEEMSITEVHVTAEAAAVVNTVVMCAIKRFLRTSCPKNCAIVSKSAVFTHARSLAAW
ncbi:MAG: hypothetical protein MR575_05200 [Bacteroides sp.]|nr:hypothetical protein [Bacteroides sp.]